MALTLDFGVVKHPFLSENLRAAQGRITGPPSYDDTNGESLTAQELKLGTVGGLFIEPASVGGVLYIAIYDIANAVVRWYVASTGAEVANAVDLSGLTARFFAIEG